MSIGSLIRLDTKFRAAVDAFRAVDADSFQRLLAGLKIGEYCELVCSWLRIKECVLECIEMCGPPREPITIEQIPKLAEIIGKIAGDEELVERLAGAIQDRNAESFNTLVKDLKIEPYCHLVCHWASFVYYRLICDVVCLPRPVARKPFVDELTAAGEAIGRLAKNPDQLQKVISAAVALDCETVSSVLGEQGGCRLVCEWICSWRCVLVCLPFCRPFPVAVDTSIEEMRAFAQVSARLADRKDVLPRLVAAVQAQDAEVFSALVKELKIEGYCIQLCHWLCFEICRRYCICVCPPVALLPEFTALGGYQYLTDINSGVTSVDADSNAGQPVLNVASTSGFIVGQSLEINQGGPRNETLVILSVQAGVSLTFTTNLGFTHTAVQADRVAGNGLTDDSRAFFSTVRLNGILTQTLNGQPMEYRFETQAYDANGNPGPWTPVLPGQIGRTVIGLWEHFKGGIPPIETKLYTVNGIPGPNELVTTISVDGWIQVPQESNVFSPAGAFFANGNMIELVTQSLAAFPAADETGVKAGAAANHPLASDAFFGIRMRVREQGLPLTETDGGTCVHVAIDNILYNNITRHPEWDGGLLPPGQLGVAMVDIKELQGNGCADLGGSLTVLFTAAHPNLGPVSIQMIGPGGPYNFTLPAIPEAGDWYGSATPSGWTVANLQPCAYIVTLSVTILLTTGDSDPNPLIDQIAFCKS